MDVLGDVVQGNMSCDVAAGVPVSVVTVFSVDFVIVGKVKSFVMVSVAFIADMVEIAGLGLSTLLEEMSSVLVTSVIELMFTPGRIMVGSVDELVSLEVLVSLSPNIKEGLVSVSILVVSE